MKTILVEPAVLELNGSEMGTVTSINIGGNCEIFGTSLNAWVSFMGSGSQLSGKNVLVTAGCSASGIDWVAVEADIISQCGLVKAANQNPEPVAPQA